jgi:hypothetical protein
MAKRTCVALAFGGNTRFTAVLTSSPARSPAASSQFVELLRWIGLLRGAFLIASAASDTAIFRGQAARFTGCAHVLPCRPPRSLHAPCVRDLPHVHGAGSAAWSCE